MEEIKAGIPPLIADLRGVINAGCNGGHELLSIKYDAMIDRIANEIGRKIYVDQPPPKREIVFPEVHEMRLVKQKIEKSIGEFEKQMAEVMTASREGVEKSAKLYKESKANELKRHANRMAELVSMITGEKATFDERITSGRDLTVASESEIKQELEAFQQQYHDYESQMTHQISQLTSRNDKEEESLRAFEIGIQNRKRELEEDFANKQKQIQKDSETKIADLEQEKTHLKEQPKRVHAQYGPTIYFLTEEIRAKKLKLDLEGQEVLREHRDTANAELETIKTRHEAEEREWNEKLAKSREGQGTNVIQLRSQMLQVSTELNKSDGETARKLKRARLDATSRVIAKDAEIKRIKAQHANEIESLEAQQNIELKTLKLTSSQIIAKLEQELVNANIESNNARIKLEEEIEKLKKAKNKHVKPPASPPPQSPRRKPRKRFGDFELIEAESRAMLNEMQKTKSQKESEIRTQKARVRARMQELDYLKTEHEKESNFIISMISNIEPPSEPHEITPREHELLHRIALQRNTIMQLRNDTEIQRVDVPKRKTLKSLQLHFKSLADDLNTRRLQLNTTLSRSIEQMSDTMNRKLKEARLQNASMILEASKRLDIALAELKETKKASEEDHMRDFQKWRELRTDIESTTRPLCDEPRPMSSVTKLNQLRLPRLNEA